MRANLKKKTTIRDVAAAAGVSHQTVSRVINDRPDVADETRRRVRQVIEELNYQPSAIARSLIQQRSLTLGVVIAGLEFFGPASILNGIASQADGMGYALLLKELSSFDVDQIDPILNPLLARQVDGVIWAVPEVGDNRAWAQHRDFELPVPTFFITMQARPDLPAVSIDNRAGGRIATEHLLEQGYRHIAHITGPLDWWDARERKAGWQDTLHSAGVQVTDQQWEVGDWSAASGERAIHRLLDKYPEMDAVFAANDQAALGVLQAIHRKGLRVPRDLAVVGFDNTVESAYYWPSLTTVKQDLQELGYTAVRELIHIIEASRKGETAIESKNIFLQPELVIRESSLAQPLD